MYSYRQTYLLCLTHSCLTQHQLMRAIVTPGAHLKALTAEVEIVTLASSAMVVGATFHSTIRVFIRSGMLCLHKQAVYVSR